MLVVSVPDSY